MIWLGSEKLWKLIGREIYPTLRPLAGLKFSICARNLDPYLVCTLRRRGSVLITSAVPPLSPLYSIHPCFKLKEGN